MLASSRIAWAKMQPPAATSIKVKADSPARSPSHWLIILNLVDRIDNPLHALEAGIYADGVRVRVCFAYVSEQA